MNNLELNKILRSVSVPEPAAGYQEKFTQQVMAEIEFRTKSAQTARPAISRWFPFLGWVRPSLGLGFCVACVLFFILFSRRTGPDGADTSSQLSASRKYYQEIEALFPRQVRAIVWDEHGAHLQLAAHADLPDSAPLFLKICGPVGCRRLVTFSGQQIQINGEACDVLIDHKGGVMVVGQHIFWTSTQVNAKAGTYRIEAKPLEGAS